MGGTSGFEVGSAGDVANRAGVDQRVAVLGDAHGDGLGRVPVVEVNSRSSEVTSLLSASTSLMSGFAPTVTVIVTSPPTGMLSSTTVYAPLVPSVMFNDSEDVEKLGSSSSLTVTVMSSAVTLFVP